MFNYKAFSLQTELTKNIFLPAESLHEFISDLAPGKIMYHCYYDFEARDTLKDYSGMLRLAMDTLHIDFDSKDDGGAAAYADVKDFVRAALPTPTVVYFSGNKGFHVAVHASAVRLEGARAHGELQEKVKSFLQNLKLTFKTVDTAIFNSNRKFRAYRSLNEKSAKYKIIVKDLDESLESIKARSADQPTEPHPLLEKCDLNPWLVSLVSATKVQDDMKPAIVAKKRVTYNTFTDKKCIRKIADGYALPGFNRHDIGLVLMSELVLTGVATDTADRIISTWASRVFPAEPARVEDMSRQLSALRAKGVDAYTYGCYNEIKKAYCSGRCALYKTLDSDKRAEVLDAPKSLSKEDKVGEGEIANTILSQLPEICKSNGDFFEWCHTHWLRMDSSLFRDRLQKLAMRIYNDKEPINKVNSLVEHVIAKIPTAPENNCFFISSSRFFNFKDCTVEVVKSETGSLSLVQHAHNKLHYLAYCAPFPLYAEHGLSRNGAFREYLETRRADIGDEGIRIVKQMLGAALIPYVPRIFFIEGESNSGKSTLAKIIIRLLGRENVSSALPIIQGNASDRFNWESCIGKLANIALELPNGILDVNTLKMVRDKELKYIDRKFAKQISATLPSLHIYCCNAMPRSYEGNSGALNKRVSMLYFKHMEMKTQVLEYGDYLWDNDAASILEVAREGLQDLISSNFEYYNSEASMQATKEWLEEGDVITLFVNDLVQNEDQCVAWENVEFEKGASIYKGFLLWCSNSGCRTKNYITRNKFYKLLRQKYNLPCQPIGKGGLRLNVPDAWKVGNFDNEF